MAYCKKRRSFLLLLQYPDILVKIYDYSLASSHNYEHYNANKEAYNLINTTCYSDWLS